MKNDLDLRQVSDQLEITVEAARQLIHRGTLASRFDGLKYWVPKTEVKRLLRDKHWRAQRSRRIKRDGNPTLKI